MTDWFVFGAGFSGLEAGRQIHAAGALGRPRRRQFGDLVDRGVDRRARR